VLDNAQQANVEQILIDIVKISLPQAAQKAVVINVDNRIATLIVSLQQGCVTRPLF
jgi:hypothetical protein